jgi:hypothetical protein
MPSRIRPEQSSIGEGVRSLRILMDGRPVDPFTKSINSGRGQVSLADLSSARTPTSFAAQSRVTLRERALFESLLRV